MEQISLEEHNKIVDDLKEKYDTLEIDLYNHFDKKLGEFREWMIDKVDKFLEDQGVEYLKDKTPTNIVDEAIGKFEPPSVNELEARIIRLNCELEKLKETNNHYLSGNKTIESIFQAAWMEAKRFKNEYIGTEHLLLGMIRTGYIKSLLKLDPRKIRLEVEKIIHVGMIDIDCPSLMFTPRAKKVLERAGEGFSTPFSLLVELLREKEGIAGQVLFNLGVKLVEKDSGVSIQEVI